MKTKSTPGPWHFDGHGINAGDGERICKVQHGDPYKGNIRNERFDADSFLIAAAPDLLETLKTISNVSRYPEHDGANLAHALEFMRELACEAIDKAEGNE